MSSVEDLILIPSESEGIPDHRCDVPFHDNSPPLDILKDQFEDLSESNEEFSLTDDDSFSFDKIDYVRHHLPILSSLAQRFNKYKIAQELWAAILKTFGGNEATRKTKKNLLKQQYGNFKAEGKETLEQTFNRIISLDTACAYIASQSNGSQIKYEDINQIDEDDIEEMDIKWNMALLSMRADRFLKKTGKRFLFNGQMAPKSQDRGRRDNYKQGSKVEEQAPKALMAIDGVGWDWSYMANEEENHALDVDEKAPTEFALMAKTSAESEVFDNSLCSKACKQNTDSLNSKITELSKKLGDTKNMLYHYKLGLHEFEDDTITDYSRPSHAIESTSDDL
nr:hypothetical protein [Tanacetum cinerariifolium]